MCDAEDVGHGLQLAPVVERHPGQEGPEVERQRDGEHDERRQAHPERRRDRLARHRVTARR